MIKIIKTFNNIGRTGTKIVICWLIFVAFMMIWLLVIAPFIPPAHKFFYQKDLATIITALLGSGGLLGSIVEIRKAIENKNNNGNNEK